MGPCPAGWMGPRGEPPGHDRHWSLIETGLGLRNTSLSPHLATCSLAECGYVTSPLLSWFLLSGRGGWSNLLRELLVLSF